ncbi:hypothetical protein Rhal01_01360 [Rubritalea halochordaticola]|uniref:Exo-alpha-sialidase n=2 Tax=Rubritalea halochordaticola TaxID=714537 RepID=A0ABP9UZM8_9BACT
MLGTKRFKKYGWVAVFSLLVAMVAQAATPTYVDANVANTEAVGGTPSPFWTTSITSDNLWRFRDGFGFDVAGNNGIYEKDGASGGYGDAAKLVTTIAGLDAGTEYGVYVNFLSASGANWRVQAGLAADSLSVYSPSSNNVENLGLTSVAGSNRNQLRAFIGNTNADANGQIKVYIDDTDASSTNDRAWYDGVSYGDPVDSTVPGNSEPVLVEDGVWTWFNDERAVWHNGKLYIGYVKKNGRISVSQYDPATGQSHESELSSVTQVDDHNNPSLHVLTNGKLLACYARHSSDNYFYYRVSNVTEPQSLSDWGAEQTHGSGSKHSYANTYMMSAEGSKLYTFTRGIGWNPNWTVSTDQGATWSTLQELVRNGGSSTRPYVRYTGNGLDAVDFIYTDGHPRNENNSIYHARIKGGNVLHTDGTVIKSLANTPLIHDAATPERGTVVYQYSSSAQSDPNQWIPGGRAWSWDIQYQKNGDPVIVFTVQVDLATGGSDWTSDRIYYYYARWNGSQWEKRFIAHAGRPLYSSEDDYAGGICIDPERPNVVYLSSNASEPFTLSSLSNVPLNAGNRYEIWKGTTTDGGASFEWEPVTMDSAVDNIRPFVPRGHGLGESVLWLQGTYSSYQNYNTKVNGKFGSTQTSFNDWMLMKGYLGGEDDDDNADGISNLVEYAAFTAGIANARDLLAMDGEILQLPSMFESSSLKAALEVSDNLLDWETLASSLYGSRFQIQRVGFGIQESNGELFVEPDLPDEKTFYRLNLSLE